MVQGKLKIDFEDPQELEILKKELLEMGVKPSEIDCLTTPLCDGTGSRVNEESRADFYAMRFASVGFVVGLLVSLFFLKFSIQNKLLFTLVVGFLFLFIGRHFGSKHSISVLEYKSGDGLKKNFTLVVEIDSMYMDEIQKVISLKRTSGVEIIYGK